MITRSTIPERPVASDSMHLLMSVLRRRRLTLAAVFIVVVAAGVAITVTTKPLYRTEVSFRAPYITSAVEPTSSKPGNSGANEVPEELLPAQVERLGSSQFLMAALSAANIKPLPQEMPPSIEVKGVDETNLIRVAVNGGNREQVAQLANKIPELHLKWLQDRQTEKQKQAAQVVQSELEKAGQRVSRADKNLLQFRRKHPIEEANARRVTRAKEQEEVGAKLRGVNVDIQTARAQISVIQSRLALEPATVVEERVAANPRVTQLKDRLASLEGQKQDLLRDFRPGSDEILAIDSQISGVQSQLTGLPETVTEKTRAPNPKRSLLEAKLTDLQAALEASQAEYRAVQRFSPAVAATDTADETQRWEMAEAALVRDRDAAQGVFTMLSSRLQALEINAATSSFVLADVQRAPVPQSPVMPQRKRDLAITLFLAGVLSLGVVFLQEYLDDRAHSPADVERLSPLTPLGEVPAMRRRQPQTIAALPAGSSISEAYRSIRSNIQFEALEGRIKRILIASPVSGDGKTLTAVNLATAMANGGKQVILVEGDLRRPGIDRHFSINPAPGISDVVAGTATLDEALQATSVPNLLVLSAGSATDAPAELLASSGFAQLMAALDDRAEVVILDSPPCLAVSDAQILAGVADGVVLVVQVGKTRVPDVVCAEEQLRRARVRVLGIVYNQVDPGLAGPNRYRYAARERAAEA